MMKRRLAVMLVLALGLGADVWAQRDPTLPPMAGAGAAGAPGAAAAWSVILVDGRPHVVSGSRLYAEGQMLGQARVERITETEIWLREKHGLRKIQIHAGVQRHSLPSRQP